MSKKLFVGMLTTAQLAAVHEAGHIIAPATQQAVSALMQLPIAQTVADDIATLKNAQLTGPQKFEQVVTKTVPAVVELLANGGVTKTAEEVGSIVRSFVQEVFNKTASTSAASVALDLLTLLGHI